MSPLSSGKIELCRIKAVSVCLSGFESAAESGLGPCAVPMSRGMDPIVGEAATCQICQRLALKHFLFARSAFQCRAPHHNGRCWGWTRCWCRARRWRWTKGRRWRWAEGWREGRSGCWCGGLSCMTRDTGSIVQATQVLISFTFTQLRISQGQGPEEDPRQRLCLKSGRFFSRSQFD